MKRRASTLGVVLISAGLVATAAALPAAAAGRGAHPMASAAAHHQRGTEIATRRIKLGRVLTNAKGRVLYIFAKDKPKVSHCSAICLSAWPRVTSVAKPRAEDGVRLLHLGRTSKHQVTYYGHPLYYFSGDTRPREASGQNVGSFFVIAASGKVIKPTPKPKPKPKKPTAPTKPAVVSTHLVGTTTVITNSAGRTLYELSGESDGAKPVFYCGAGCTSLWVPLLTKGTPTAKGGAMVGDLGTVKRPNGTTQATYDHHPLYTYVPDTSAGTATGEGAYESPTAGYWYDLAPDGSPIL